MSSDGWLMTWSTGTWRPSQANAQNPKGLGVGLTPDCPIDQWWPSPLTESGLLLAAGLLPLWSRGRAPGRDGTRKPWVMSSSPRRTSTRLAAMVTRATWSPQSGASPPTETNSSPAPDGAGDRSEEHTVIGRQSPRDRRML